MEIWKDIPGYEGKYQASTEGRIRSLDYNKTNQVRVMKPRDNGLGYKSLDLSLHGRIKSQYVHRLVAMTFIPNPRRCKTVNHISGDKADNRVSNLEWATYSENVRHGYATGLYTIQRGEETSGNKLTESEVCQIREKYKTGNYTQQTLADTYGVSIMAVNHIIKRRTWTHI